MKLYYERHEIGNITIDERTKSPAFRYNQAWLSADGSFPISTTMPLSEEDYPWSALAPWLINLLPEDHEALKMMARNVDVPSTDVLALLEKVGRDTSGAVSFAERGTTSDDVIRVENEADLERIINELPSKPFLAGEQGISMSLAGVQTKLAVRVLPDSTIGIPVNGSASSHILKPDAARLYGGVHNEALCLTLAKLCKLNAPRVTTGVAGSRTYLLVERYDRVLDEDRLRRIHQEDFCQALGLLPSSKYQHNSVKGKKIKFGDLVDRLREVSGVGEVERLWNMLVFNVLCCNTDAHAKNYSILIYGDSIELAPIYDVMCAERWAGITPYLAFDVGSQRKWRDIEGRHWKRMAMSCGLSAQFGIQSVLRLADTVMDNLEEACAAVKDMPAGAHPMLDEFVEAIRQCCVQIKATAGR